jgi:hypothetical protein
MIVKIDPLEILKMKIKEMEDNYEKVGQCVTQLRQVIDGLSRKIQKNTNTVENSMQKAAYAKKVNANVEQIYLESRRAGRREKSNMTLKDLKTKIEAMHRVLSKIHSNTAVIIEDSKDEIEVTSEEYRATKIAHSAMKSAMNLIHGNKDKRAIYEEAYEYLALDLSNKSGELIQMLDTSKNLIENIDIENGLLQENGLKMLEEWEKKADSWLTTSSQKSDAVSKAGGNLIEQKSQIPFFVEEGTPNSNQFGQFFDKK